MNIVPYNPKFIIILGILHNLAILGIKIKYKSQSILFFILAMTFLKVIPLATIYHTTISTQDILASLVLFIIYIIYIQLQEKNVLGFFNLNLKNIIDDKDNTPIVAILTSLFS
jgi:hypothetical protein